MPVVAKLEKVRKVYDLGEVKVEALAGVDVEFEEGDFVAIMGSSGSGKSTMLNILGCLDRPSSGDYFLGDQNVAHVNDDDLSEIRGQRLGFIFQSYNLIQQLTVVENIEVPLFYQGKDTPEMREYCIALATRLGLGERLDHRPMQLSGGQQQRVAIARALVNDPYVILADEATGNLDSRTSDEIMALLCQLNESGKTIVMVTHEDDIAEYARRVVKMKDGRIVEDEVNTSRRKPVGQA
jgi:putative ABC transport system ATP-binding protein